MQYTRAVGDGKEGHHDKRIHNNASHSPSPLHVNRDIWPYRLFQPHKKEF